MNETKTMDRNEAVKRIRVALRQRSGKAWSVTCGRGTAWGWITIDVPPAREASREADLKELAALLGLDRVHHQGMLIAAGSDYREEYVARAEGRTPAVVGVPYWD